MVIDTPQCLACCSHHHAAHTQQLHREQGCTCMRNAGSTQPRRSEMCVMTSCQGGPSGLLPPSGTMVRIPTCLPADAPTCTVAAARLEDVMLMELHLQLTFGRILTRMQRRCRTVAGCRPSNSRCIGGGRQRARGLRGAAAACSRLRRLLPAAGAAKCAAVAPRSTASGSSSSCSLERLLASYPERQRCGQVNGLAVRNRAGAINAVQAHG
jgi:hypothetical protein